MENMVAPAKQSNSGKANAPMAESREVMNIRQASQYLGVSPDTLYKYVYEEKDSGVQAGQPLEDLKNRSSTSGWKRRASECGKRGRRRSPKPDARGGPVEAKLCLELANENR